MRARRLMHARPDDLRTAVWTLRAWRAVRTDLRRRGVGAAVIAPTAPVAAHVRDVESTLKYLRATCLERSMVVQRVLSAGGVPHPVAVGVRYVRAEVEAHAWIVDYDLPSAGYSFSEISRIEPPPR